MYKILIVDDEQNIRQLVVRYAEHEGFETVQAEDGASALDLCRSQGFDAVIMDIMMPGMDGFEAAREIRRLPDKNIPIILLSALGSEDDKLMGFELGIDDYVVKPFSPRELMARVRAVIARSGRNNGRSPAENDGQILGSENISIDLRSRNVYIDGENVQLTAKEFELLKYFLTNPGQALTREQILSAVWGYDYEGEDRTIDWQVKLLRGKLGKYRDKITTLRGVGYRFEK